MCSEEQQGWGEVAGGRGEEERDASLDKGREVSRRLREAIGETLTFLTWREGRTPLY